MSVRVCMHSLHVLGCDGALRHVVANLADRENGPVTNERGFPPQLVWPKPQLFQCGNFAFALGDCVINAGVISQLVSLNLKHFWQHRGHTWLLCKEKDPNPYLST